MGAEIGNSTQKLHARGPIGLRELTSYKFVVEGSGPGPGVARCRQGSSAAPSTPRTGASDLRAGGSVAARPRRRGPGAVGEAPHRTIEQDPGAGRAHATVRAAPWRLTSGSTCPAIEVERPGPSYTVDTLRLLRERSPDARADADPRSRPGGARCASWREPEGVLSLARVAVADRGGLERDAVLRQLDGLAGGRAIDVLRHAADRRLVDARPRAGRRRSTDPLPRARRGGRLRAARGLYAPSVPVSTE